MGQLPQYSASLIMTAAGVLPMLNSAVAEINDLTSLLYSSGVVSSGAALCSAFYSKPSDRRLHRTLQRIFRLKCTFHRRVYRSVAGRIWPALRNRTDLHFIMINRSDVGRTVLDSGRWHLLVVNSALLMELASRQVR